MKKIILISVLLLSVSNAEMNKQDVQGAVLNGFYDGVTGIFKSTVDLASNPNEAIQNAKNYKDKKEKSQLEFYKKQYEARGKALSKISRDKMNVISKLNKEKREWIKKYNKLKEENKKLKITIKKYNMYYKNKKANQSIKKEEAIKKMRMNWKSN